MPTTTPMASLTELNRCTPNRLPDALRLIKQTQFGQTEYKGFGDLLNALIAQGNAGSASTQASQTVTIAGVPAAADTITVNMYSPNAGAVATVITTLSAGQAASVTTAAAAVIAAVAADPVLGAIYAGTQAAGVITFKPLRKGTGGNGKAISCSATGGSTATAGGATFAGGTGVDDICAIAD